MASSPGWHPDPSGRHQHRFWDGERWTDQVADAGTTGTDPVDAAPMAPTTAGAAAVAPAPSGARSKGPLFVGLAILVAVVVAAAVFFVSGDDDDAGGGGGGGGGGGTTSETTDGPGEGAGDFTLAVSTDELTVHPLEIAAGDAMALRVTGSRRVAVAVGMDRATAERLIEVEGLLPDGYDLPSLYADSNDAVTDELFTDLTDEQADVLAAISSDDEGFVELPGYDGLVLYALDVDELADDYDDDTDAKSTTLVAPADLGLSVLLISEEGDQEVELQVRTSTNPDLPDLDTFDSDTFDALSSDGFYSDFFSETADDFGVVRSEDSDDFSDDFSTDFSDDFSTDFSDEFSDDFSTDLSDEFSS